MSASPPLRKFRRTHRLPDRLNLDRDEAATVAPATSAVGRNLVEWFFDKIKHRRRVATRYDKVAANYRAFVQLASIRIAAAR
jgi:hypothetical protein